MIAVHTGGQLGNQMFQLAFAYTASRRLGTSYVLIGPMILPQHFQIPVRVRLRCRRAAQLAFVVRHGRVRTVVFDNDEHPDDVLARVSDGNAFGGYYQSERYFAGYEDDVRSMFRVRDEHVAAFRQRYEDLPPYVCVHMRRGDYLKAKWALPASYFRDAIEMLPDRAGKPLIVVSDDIELAREEVGDIPGTRFESNSAIVDLQLLMNASCVIASNSSFSWWGAWLNRRPDLRVLAPQRWLGFRTAVEEPSGVIPARWQQVPVTDIAR